MIDEKKLINTLRPYYDKVLEQNISHDEKLAKHDMLSDVIVEIKKQPKISDCISCNERLPETFEKFLVFTDNGCSYIARLNRIGEWVSIAEKVTAKIEHSKVIAWRALYVVSSM